ncbi:MAG: hypothetical protein JRI57_04800 [Deltaproteobacteria bacterium]|nr:hypothetical protein [Deltaproteobacteria bacterium]MBW1952570.1 hypothetical protein [Deltaproteobacteria bacterium]MBW1986137.1 hypothetical protein [Deltaproteobacteria bacterium]MBW2134177.1 hypothetical protein [Deltaproteobacteria bacterium]
MKKNVLILLMALALVALGVAVASAGPWVEKATGGGTNSINIPIYGKTSLAFTAQKDKDGNVKGQAQFNIHGNPNCGRFHVKVQCLRVEGNEAWIGGTIIRAKNPKLVGKVIVWQVADNGQGAGSDPDQVSAFPFAANPCQCMCWPDLELFDWPNGNIQVKERRLDNN